MIKKIYLVYLFLFLIPTSLYAQVEEDKLGAWYMLFWNTTLKESSIGFQGDIQHRNWNVAGDLEQLLLRGGITYTPKNANIKFTAGYGYVLSGAYGSSDAKSEESRIYQEALFPQKIGQRFHLNHRARYEQRFVENQDFRTRFRYAFFMNIAFNSLELDAGTIYLALYNELFINGERDIGNGNSVEYFDRNRAYFGLGYALKKQQRVQLGLMRQFTNTWSKSQLQVSLHQSF